MRDYWRQIAMAVLAFIFVVSTAWYSLFRITALRDARRLEALAESTHPTTGLVTQTRPRDTVPTETDAPEAGTAPEETVRPTTPPMRNWEKFANLYGQNPDFAGWLTFKDLNISYPVMLSPQDPEFYLYRNFEGKSSATGVPFMDAKCTPFSNSILIYGHNMQNGTVFAPLKRYDSQSFAESHPYFQFETMYYSGVYQVIAVYYESIHYADDKDAFRFYTYVGDLDETRFNDYVARSKAASTVDLPDSAEYGDELLALITCAYNQKNGRFVLLARRVYYEDVIEELYGPGSVS